MKNHDPAVTIDRASMLAQPRDIANLSQAERSQQLDFLRAARAKAARPADNAALREEQTADRQNSY